MIMMWFAIYFYTITRERRSMDYYVVPNVGNESNLSEVLVESTE